MSHYANSVYADYDDFGYEGEASWEQRRKEHNKQVYSHKIRRWSPPTNVSKRQECILHAQLMTTELEKLGCRKLVDSYLCGEDGFPYHVSGYEETYHQSLLFQAPENKSLVLAVKYSTGKYADGSGYSQYLSLDLMGESTSPLQQDFGGVVDIWGLHNCGGSYGGTGPCNKHGRATTGFRWSFNSHYEENFHGESLPDISHLMRNLKHGVVRIWNDLCDGSMIDHHYLGSTFDGSYVFPADQTRADNTPYDLFWKRAGGRQTVLGFIPNASFSKPFKCVDGSYHHY